MWPGRDGMAAFQGEPPAVARQRVRRALRQARQATPMSQSDVARELGWSLSKMQRIEAGEVGVSPTDLRALLDIYGITDPDEVRRLNSDARASRRQRWWTVPEYREHLTPALRKLMQFEAEAVAIRAYQPIFFPGVLQTPAVADAILDWWSLSEEGRRVRYDVRMRRSKRVVESDDDLEFLLVLDESVLKRRTGGTTVAAEQLEFIAAVAQQPRMHIRVVPFAKAAYIGSLGPFQILELSDNVDDAILYRESYGRDEIVHDPAEISFHRDAFENLWKVALSEDSSYRAIAEEAAQLRSVLGNDSQE